jgi:hypothetical protein
MNTGQKSFVRVAGEVRGPYDVAQLAGLAEAGVVTPATESAVAMAGPWWPLAAHPAHETIFPPRTELGLKPVEPAMVTGDTALPRINLTDILEAAVMPGRVLRPSHPPDLAAFEAAKNAAPLNDVQKMVRAVDEAEARFAPPFKLPPRKPLFTRRAKTIVVLAVLGNALLFAIPVAYDALGDTWAMVVFRGWFVLLNGALAILFVAMPKE